MLKKFWHRPDQRRERGQAIVEFALMMALFLVFMLALIDLGRAYFAMVAVQNAAGEGALYGMSNPQCVVNPGSCSPPNNVLSRVRSESDSRLIDPAKLNLDPLPACDPADCAPGAMLTVTVSYDFELLVPGLSAFGADVITLRRSSIQLVP